MSTWSLLRCGSGVYRPGPAISGKGYMTECHRVGGRSTCDLKYSGAGWILVPKPNLRTGLGHSVGLCKHLQRERRDSSFTPLCLASVPDVDGVHELGEYILSCHHVTFRDTPMPPWSLFPLFLGPANYILWQPLGRQGTAPKPSILGPVQGRW